MKRCSGQVLLPGLVFFLGLLFLFFAMVRMGNRTLVQMRMDMAAEAAALSSARAQAELLNQYAAHNLMVNILAPKLKDYAVAELPGYYALIALALYENVENRPTFLRLPRLVGNTVALLNGATERKYDLLDNNPKLTMESLQVLIFEGIYPVGVEEVPQCYYVRQWAKNERKAQPTHKATWSVGRGDVHSRATARLYLDVEKNESAQNGGFPRPQGEESLAGSALIQSFYPQFNAQLKSSFTDQLAGWLGWP